MADRLELVGLRVAVGSRPIVTDVDLTLEAGKIVALVGASGSGKTVTARSLLGLVDVDPGVIAGDLRIVVGSREVRPYAGCLGRGPRERDRAFAGVRGDLVGYLPQDARAALDPLQRVGRQVMRAALNDMDPHGWLTRAGLADAERVARLYPHELSGGMAQRVVIAQALARRSRFLLADEPTTALDPTVQVGILDEIRHLALEGVGVLFITHDLRILSNLADEVLVMHEGRIVERSTPDGIRGGSVTSEPAQRLVEATRRVAAGRLG